MQQESPRALDACFDEVWHGPVFNDADSYYRWVSALYSDERRKPKKWFDLHNERAEKDARQQRLSAEAQRRQQAVEMSEVTFQPNTSNRTLGSDDKNSRRPVSASDDVFRRLARPRTRAPVREASPPPKGGTVAIVSAETVADVVRRLAKPRRPVTFRERFQ